MLKDPMLTPTIRETELTEPRATDLSKLDKWIKMIYFFYFYKKIIFFPIKVARNIIARQAPYNCHPGSNLLQFLPQNLHILHIHASYLDSTPLHSHSSLPICNGHAHAAFPDKMIPDSNPHLQMYIPLPHF